MLRLRIRKPVAESPRSFASEEAPFAQTHGQTHRPLTPPVTVRVFELRSPDPRLQRLPAHPRRDEAVRSHGLERSRHSPGRERRPSRARAPAAVSAPDLAPEEALPRGPPVKVRRSFPATPKCRGHSSYLPVARAPPSPRRMSTSHRTCSLAFHDHRGDPFRLERFARLPLTPEGTSFRPATTQRPRRRTDATTFS